MILFQSNCFFLLGQFLRAFEFSAMDTLDLEPVQEMGERVNVIIININMSIEIANIIIVMIVLISK